MTAKILPLQREIVHHNIKIRRASIGWAATCSCGWRSTGIDKQRIEAMAGSHDLDGDDND